MSLGGEAQRPGVGAVKSFLPKDFGCWYLHDPVECAMMKA